MLSVARLRAKLSRVPFSRRVFLALPAGAAAYGVQWRLTVANTDDSLALEEAAAYATASSPTHEGGPTSASSAVAPAAHREAKWAQIVALSDRWDAYKAAKKATAEEMARVLADTARRAGRGGGTTEESRRRDEERLAAVEAKAAAVAAPPVLDLVVIGAGANGLFVTLEAARRGLSVATFEACDVGGASSSVGTPNTLTSFLPHFNRAIRVFSAEELWEGWGQLKELRQMGVYTTPLLSPSPSPPSSSILSSDVGMVYAAASRLEAWDTVLTTALWAVSAAFIGAASPTGLVGPTVEQRRQQQQQKRQREGGAANSFLSSSDVATLWGSAHMAAPGAAAIARLSEAVAPFLPLRPVSPSWLSLTSDWVGATDAEDVDTQSGLQHSGDGAVVATVRPAAALYMRHSRIDGNAMAIALATTAERLSRGRLEAKRRAAEKSSSLANTHQQQLTFSAASAAASEGLPDTAIILNYCPVQSVGVDPQTGLFRVTVKNLKMAPQDAKSRAARRAAGSEGTEDSRGTAAAASYVMVTARNVVNCSGPWVDALRAAEVRGDVGCDDFSLRAAGRGGEETFAADTKETTSSSATTSDDPEVLALAGAAPSSEGAHGGGASSSLIAPADDTMGVLDSKGLRTPLPPRRLLREKAPEKASGYEVRQAFAGLDYDGEKMLMNSSSGHIYFVVRNSDMVAGDAGVRGCVRTAAPAEAEPADTGSEAKAAPSSASSSFFSRFFSTPHSVATLPHINSAMTLTSDAARRYVTVTPFGAPGAGLSLVGLSTVSLPLLGWRGEPPLSGLPFADVKSHFAPLYAWLRDISAESGIALPPAPLSCALSASGSMAPLSSIAREVYCSGNAAEAVRVKGAAEGSTLYHVVGGTWLTARRVGADVAADINRSRLAREATAKAADEAKARGSSAFMPPSDAEVGAMLAAAEAPFVRPLRLVGTSSSTVSASPSDEAVPAEVPSAAAEAKLVAAQLTAAMTGDPYVASLVDVIGRRTLVAYAHHAAVLRMLPALVEAMAAQQPRGYEWSAARRAEELAAAKAFMAGIAPPSSDDFTKKKL